MSRRQSTTSPRSALNGDVAEHTPDDTRRTTPPPTDQDPSQASEEPQHNKTPKKGKKKKGDRMNKDEGSSKSDAGDTDQPTEQRRVSTSAPTHDNDERGEVNDGNSNSQMAQMAQMLDMMNRMQQKLEELDAKSNYAITLHHSSSPVGPETPSTTQADAPPDPLQEAPKGPKNVHPEDHVNPGLERRTISFLDKANATRQPMTLKGSRNYEEWKQSVMGLIQQLACVWILENQEEECPSTLSDRKLLWDVQNQWLYDYILDSIEPSYKKKIRIPEKLSAYLLWAEIEACFNKTVEEERRLALYMLYTYRASDDNEYIKGFKERVHDIKMIGFNMPDWILMDLLWMGLSERSRDFVQLQIDSKRTSTYIGVTLNVEQLLADILNYLSPGDAPSAKPSPQPKAPLKEPGEKGLNSSASQGSADRGYKGPGPPGGILCRYCGMTNHIQRNCLYKHPEVASEKWQSSNKHAIEFLRTQTETRKAISKDPRNGCSYCGMKMHVEDGCKFKYPEMKSRTWLKENKNLIEYFRRKAEGVQIEPVHLHKTAKVLRKPEFDDAHQLARPPSPENLLILDL